MNFLGIGSGLDLSTMLTQLVQVASEPKIKQLGAKEVEAKDAISGLGTLSSLMSKFQDASNALKDSSAYNNRTASITQPSGGSVISITPDSDAVTGTYNISVEQLAQGTKGYTTQMNTDHTAALGKASDTLTFSLPDASESPFSIVIDPTMSLEDIRDAINESDDNFGIKVNVVDGRLTYESSVTGAAIDKELQITSANLDADFSISVFTQNAQQAQLKIDGIDVFGDDNVFDTEISGLTITALKADPGQNAVADISMDTGSVKKKIESFAQAYNELREGMNGLKGSFDENDKFIPGKLTGDPIIRSLEGFFGGVLTQQVSGAASNMDTLYSVGLDIQSDGTLSVDSARLSSALENNFDGFDELFSGTNGLAYNLSDQLDSYIGFTGILKGKEDSYKSILDDLEKQYDDHSRYIESYQKTLKQQFVALDRAIASMNSTMSYIGPQLAALSGTTYSNNKS